MNRPSPPEGQSHQILEKQITQAVRTKYLLFVPKDYHAETGRSWPLILFLHGAGERGDDLDLVAKHGPPKVVRQREDFPFIVVAPQCPAEQWWRAQPLAVLLDEVQAHLRIDPDRIYLTGLSMGGYGVWEMALTYPDRFAAIAPVCGGGVPLLIARIVHLPAWVFHGAGDDVVPVEESSRMVEALERAGGCARLTVYPEAGHDCWTRTYDDPKLYHWFLQHRRRATGRRRDA